MHSCSFVYDMTSFLQKLIFAGIVAILMLPLIPDVGNFFYPFGRDVLFRITVEIIGLAYLILAIRDRTILPKISPLGILIVSFFIANTIATLLAIQPQLSFWGDPLRNNGLFSHAHLILFFFILTSMARSLEKWRSLWILISITALLAALSAVLQTIFSNVTRVYGTLGNPNFLGAWILLVVFVTFIFFLKERGGLKIIHGTSVFFQIIALLLTFSRGAYLGLVAGAILLSFALPSTSISPRLKRILRLSMITALFFTITAFSLARLPLTQKMFAPFPNIQRVLAVSLSDATAQTRIESWRGGILAIEDRPLFGFGPENFSAPFDLHYRGTFEHLAFQETWADRAHNVFIDVGATSGLTGLGAFIGIFALLFFNLFFLLKKGLHNDERMLSAGLGATYGAYLTQNSFNLDTPLSLIYLYTLFAFTHSLIQFAKNTNSPTLKISKSKILNPKQTPSFAKTTEGARNSKSKNLLVIGYWSLVILCIPLLLFCIKKWNVDLLAANYHLNKGQALYENGAPKEALIEYEKGLASWTPVAQFLHYEYAANTLLYLNEKEDIPDSEIRELLAKALTHVDKVIQERPFYTRAYILGGLLANTGYEQIDASYKKIAEEYLTRAQALSPQRSSILKIWALTDLVEKNFTGAQEKLLRAIAINPDAQEVHWVLALTYLRSNQLEKFQKEYNEEKKRNTRVEDEFNLIKIADICFREIKQYQCAADFFARLTEKNPQNPKYWTSLALSYKGIGNIDGARQAALHAKTIADPAIQKIIDEFLKTL